MAKGILFSEIHLYKVPNSVNITENSQVLSLSKSSRMLKNNTPKSEML